MIEHDEKRGGDDADAVERDAATEDEPTDTPPDNVKLEGEGEPGSGVEGDEAEEPVDEDGDDGSKPEEKTLPAEKLKINFKGAKGDNVPGYLWLPARKAGAKFPAVIMMYGIKGNKDSGDIARAGEALQKDGMIGLTLDWPGTGARTPAIGNGPRIQGDVLDWTVGDYGQALAFLKARGEVDAQKIGYVGASMGAMTGLVFAASQPAIKAMVAIVPIPDPLWGGNDPQNKVGQVRTLLCISTADNSDHSGDVCSKASGTAEKKALPGGHELEGYKDNVIQVTRAFLAKHLKK